MALIHKPNKNALRTRLSLIELDQVQPCKLSLSLSLFVSLRTCGQSTGELNPRTTEGKKGIAGNEREGQMNSTEANACTFPQVKSIT